MYEQAVKRKGELSVIWDTVGPILANEQQNGFDISNFQINCKEIP